MKILKIMGILLVVVCFCSCFILPLESARAQDKKQESEPKIEHVIVSVHSNFGPVPATLKIHPGTTVVWINDGNAHVKIKFTGKQVTLACGSPSHFVVNEDGAYESPTIPLGASASLCFVQKGEFDYVMERPFVGFSGVGDTTPKTFKGKITVE